MKTTPQTAFKPQLSNCTRKEHLSFIKCMVLGVILWCWIISQASADVGSQDPNGFNSGNSDNPTANTTPSAQLAFQTDLFTGRFGYTVPLNVAPARHDSAPNIALRYNSSGDNGWCGVGWSLDLGYIERETRKGVPIYWANGSASPKYDDAKGFVFSLNGRSSSLVMIPSGEYRAEIENGFLVFQLVTSGNYWLVIDKSGNKYYFGKTSDGSSRMSNSKTGWSPTQAQGTFRWALDRIETINGDVTTIAYTTITSNLYPQLLSYNGHTSGLAANYTVQFNLADRSDARISCKSGYRVDQTKRLNSIVHKVNGQVVWNYTLNYTNSPSTGRSLLNSITRYGTNQTDSLPPIIFGYSQQTFGFNQPITWTNVFVPPSGTTPYLNFSLNGSQTELVDMDGDGLPDRVVSPAVGPYTNWWVQLNTGNGFGAATPWKLGQQVHTDSVNGTTYTTNDWMKIGSGHGRLLDINGDGKVDRVTDPYEAYFNINFSTNTMLTNYDRLVVELNGSTNLLPALSWAGVEDQIYGTVGSLTTVLLRAVENGKFLRMIDVNGDGLLDRVMVDRALLGSYAATNYIVQFNTGAGFSGTNKFGPFFAQGFTNDANWVALASDLGFMRMLDINGDGLPDRVMLVKDTTVSQNGAASAQYQTNLVVELNNGYGFEPAMLWTNVDSQYNLACGVSTPTSGFADLGDSQYVALRDVNGDGLPDRIFLPQCQPFTKWKVQLNTGAGFGPTQDWGTINTQGQTTDSGWCGIQSTYAMLMDMDGDGLPDRVTTAYSGGNVFFVELSKGPVPDLLTVVSNGIGGSINVNYKFSTKYDNRDSSGRQLLPFPQWTVSSVSISDGIYPSNVITYSYEGGYWNYVRREFNGFSKTTVSDPLGLTNVHWFHQSGGRDNSAYGEYLDTTNAIAKKGMPFRVDTIGSDGKVYKTALSVVQDADLGSGRHFAYVGTNITIDYPGGSTSASRASAEGYFYNLSTGNLTNTTTYGEVSGVSVGSQGAVTFSDIGNDTVYQITTFATLSNTNIIGKPSSTVLASDSAGQNVLRETLYDYDGATGNLTRRRGRICSGSYMTIGYAYDSYGNTWHQTNAAGVLTETTYESTYQTFPSKEIIGGTLTNLFTYDARSGKVSSSTDPSGLVTMNSYDSFLRLTETDVSTTANGAANHWLAYYNYTQGIANGRPNNSIRVRKADGVDSTNGRETWTWSDGLGRAIQVRGEAEASAGSGQYRVTDTIYDNRGSLRFLTLPYFSSGTAFSTPATGEIGGLYEYDPIGRLTKVTAGVNGTFTSGQLTSTSATSGDGSSSPLAPSTIVYYDGTDPWTIVSTDEASKQHKYCLDAYGQTNKITEVTSQGNFTTTFGYNLAGDLLSITNNANNVIQYAYDNLGQLVAMADPDMGSWKYQRDYAGRLREQTDANGQLVRFNYADPLGRVASRQVYDFKGVLAYGVTNVYDSNTGDSAFTVYPGELYKTTDKEGWEKFSYDLRGRTVKKVRYLSKNGNTYTNQFSYDDMDRLSSVVYPNNGPTVASVYDSGGNLSLVKQVGGSGATYYTAGNFDAVGHLKGVTYGNGVTASYLFYTYSGRLQQLTSSKSGTTLQNLTYTFDAVSNVKSITDGVYSSGAASATLSGLTYDDLHRLTALTRPTGSVSFSYDSLGNLTVNGEAGSGTYNYGTRAPHTVKSANGKNYAYDLNGNMLVRGSQHLEYDPENHLVLVRSTSSTTTFGYAGDGGRLWKQTATTNGLQVWIGNTYEEKNGRILYHIRAGGQLVCTFDSTSAVCDYYQSDHLHSTSILTDASGNKTQHYEYSVFGRDRFTESTTAFPISNRFTGQVKDEDTGLYYYGARYYDPELGRFIQADSIIPNFANPQNLNRYSYALNNPLRFTDPSGHIWYDSFAAWSAGNAAFSKNFINQSMPWQAAGVFNSVIDLGQALASAPAVIGHLGEATGATGEIGNEQVFQPISHLGEGAGTFAGNPTLENSAGMFQDISVTASIVAAGASAVQSARPTVAGSCKTATTAGDVEPTPQTADGCFVAGTLIATANGLVPIEKVKVGDKVWSFDESSGTTTLRNVTRTFVREAEETVTLKIGTELTTATLEHPFWVENVGWKAAGTLMAGNVIRTLAGELIAIDIVRTNAGVRSVYNFEVAESHSYFVSVNRVLVHNACSQSDGGKPHLNSNDAKSNFGLYEIKVKGDLHKIGKADLNRVTKSSGLPTRLHQQLRKLRKISGEENVNGKVVEDLGETTTAEAKAAENARIQDVVDETGEVPPGNQDSFEPEP